MEGVIVGNFMKAYTIAFETNNGGQVASRAIVPFFKKIEDILEETPENVIRRINSKIMRIHAYEWNHMKEDYLVVPIGKLKEKNKPFGSDPETQKLIDIPQERYLLLSPDRTYTLGAASKFCASSVRKAGKGIFLMEHWLLGSVIITLVFVVAPTLQSCIR